MGLGTLIAVVSLLVVVGPRPGLAGSENVVNGACDASDPTCTDPTKSTLETLADTKANCWSRALKGGCGANGAEQREVMKAECPASCDKVKRRSLKKGLAEPRTAYTALPTKPHRLPPPYSKDSPPPGHLGSLFEMPKRLGFVDEVGPGEYPTPLNFHRLYAPTIDSQRRSIDCQREIDVKCGKKKNKSQKEKDRREKCYSQHREELYWRCGDLSRGTPLLLKGYAKSFPAFTKWSTDANLVNMYGSVPLRGIEIGPRQETRKHEMGEMTLAEFISAKANDTDERAHYVVDPFPPAMLGDVHIPSVLRCSGATEKKMKFYMWMSAGGTKSVIHNDQYDNINCVYAGSKRFFIADARYSSIITHQKCGWVDVNRELDAMGVKKDVDMREQLGYGAFGREINVSSVDLARFPCWAHIPWKEAVVNAGDCLFLPQWHFHHVESFAGEGDRNLASNLWWKRLQKFNPKAGFGCKDETPVPMASLLPKKTLNFGMY